MFGIRILCGFLATVSKGFTGFLAMFYTWALFYLVEMFLLCRMLVYEYVNNGNLEQWLHGAMRQHGTLT